MCAGTLLVLAVAGRFVFFDAETGIPTHLKDSNMRGGGRGPHYIMGVVSQYPRFQKLTVTSILYPIYSRSYRNESCKLCIIALVSISAATDRGSEGST